MFLISDKESARSYSFRVAIQNPKYDTGSRIPTMMHGHLCARRAACVRSWDRGRTPVLSPRPFCPQFYGRINPLSLEPRVQFFGHRSDGPSKPQSYTAMGDPDDDVASVIIIPGWMCSLPLKIDQKVNELLFRQR